MNTILIFAAIGLQTITIDDAVRIAEANHPSLRAAAAQTQRAGARAAESRAPLYPQLDASARYGATATAPTSFDRIDGRDSLGATLSASFLLWDFGRARLRTQAADAAVDAQRASQLAAGNNVALGVQLAYIEARASKALLAVARETLDNEQRLLGQAEAFVAAGTRPEIDLARLRTQVARARADLLRTENDHAVAMARLHEAMGVLGRASYALSDAALPAIAGEQSATGTLVDEALQRRPELAAIEADLRAQRLTATETGRGMLPSVRVGADAGYSHRDALGGGFSASVGVTLSWPIFDGFATRHRARGAELGVVALEAERDARRLGIWLEIEEARATVRSSTEQVAATRLAVEAARELLRLAVQRYEAGVGDSIELATAQVEVTSAASQQVRAELTLAAARARLLRALGRTQWQ
jgi:outer membrane protein